MTRAECLAGFLLPTETLRSTAVRGPLPVRLARRLCVVLCCLAVFGQATASVAQMSSVPLQTVPSDSCPDCDTPYANTFGEQPTLPPFAARFVGPSPDTCGEPHCSPLKARIDAWLHPPGRHRGLGHPLQRESWLFRPFGAGWFMGMAQGGRAIRGRIGSGDHFRGGVGMKQGFIGGYRLGWDSSHYWGGELRMSFASIELFDSAAARAAQEAADAELGLEDNDPWRDRFDHRRDATVQTWDVNLIYYPWGDSRWRPYTSLGLGANRIRLIDRLDRRYDSYLLAMPIGFGLKYRCNDRLALRFDVTDNIAFGGGSSFVTQHNLAATFGLEVRFGGTRKAYWPWNPGRHYW